jgi:hypothetical protein
MFRNPKSHPNFDLKLNLSKSAVAPEAVTFVHEFVFDAFTAKLKVNVFPEPFLKEEYWLPLEFARPLYEIS